VPVYLEELAKYLEQERAELRKEVEALKGNIGHIKDIVAMQQENARMFGVVETLPLSDLVEDALKLNGAGYARHGVTVKREYDPLPIVAVDKHKALQILVNLLSNAKYACDAGRATEKRVVVRLKAGDEGRVRIEVADNGVGIASDNLTRIFSQGYTTRKGGHGFGLHTSALAAGELGGALTVHSEGLGQGATFTLELPVTPPVASVPSADDSKQIGLE
jgi:signal transduction histidine kinase